MKICPRCDGQGKLLRVAIVPLNNHIVYICDECEALWEQDKIKNVDDYVDFSQYMEQKGIPASWQSVKILE